VNSNRAFASIAVVTLSLAGCDDHTKANQEGAAQQAQALVVVLKEDVAQVRRGLPVGAKELAGMLDADTLASPQALQKAIARARAIVPDLSLAKSTFFCFTDSTGIVLRSEVDPDLLAGKSMVAAFPPLKKALEATSPPVEVFGEMKELRGVRNGPDLAWVVAAPTTDTKGANKGMFVTGWSFRSLAYHLELSAKMRLMEATEKAGKQKAPFAYVYVIKGKTAYGTPTTPDVNAKFVEDLDPLSKAGPTGFRGSAEIAGRAFGVAIERVRDLGDDVALAVLYSEI
jgi:hypothetical protein